MKSRSFCALAGAALALSISTASVAKADAITYSTVGTYDFVVPVGVSSLTILAVGGGGGGANGHQGGGGAGYVVGGEFSVIAGTDYQVVVGAGGTGAASANNSNDIVGLTAGGASSFGNIVIAQGGKVVTGINQGGQNGSSGGGGSCNAGSLGGAGGSGGSNGSPCAVGTTMPIGFGQGSYASLLSLFLDHTLTAGAGGAGGTGTHAGGGGAGGVLIDGFGPVAGNGLASFSAHGGTGYGAGGGAGGLNFNVDGIRYGGGNGADGLVYIEFAAPSSVPGPIVGAGLPGLIAAFGGLLAMRRRRARC